MIHQVKAFYTKGQYTIRDHFFLSFSFGYMGDFFLTVYYVCKIMRFVIIFFTLVYEVLSLYLPTPPLSQSTYEIIECIQVHPEFIHTYMIYSCIFR
jgi:hypothetical protein